MGHNFFLFSSTWKFSYINDTEKTDPSSYSATYALKRTELAFL